MEGVVKVEGYAPVVNMNVSIVEAVEAFLSECDIRANSKNVYRRGLLNFFKWVEQTERVISMSKNLVVSFPGGKGTEIPLLYFASKFYEDKGVLYKLDANGTIDEVWERLLDIIK